MHDTLKEMYSNEQNISCVADLYEQLFSLTEWSFSIWLLFWVEGDSRCLDFDQPIVLDLKVLQRYRDELVVIKFLSD